MTAALPVGKRIVVYSEEKPIHEKAAVIILSISIKRIEYANRAKA